MGLDIYLYQYDSDSDHTYSINQKDLNNPYLVNFLTKHKKHLIAEENSYYDLDKYLKLNNILREDLSYTIFGDEVIITFSDGHEIRVPEDEFPIDKKDEYYINVTSIEYQRKGMKEAFYTEYLRKDKYIFWTNKQLDEIKRLSEKDAYIRNWHLDKNQFIVCDC